MRSSVSLAIAVLASAASAACSPSWVVVKQASPDPMGPSAAFFVAPVSFDGLRVGDKPEADWVADKDDEGKAAWKADKLAASARFSAGFEDGRGDAKRSDDARGAFVVKARLVRYEPGSYTYIQNHPVEIDAEIEIDDPAGAVVDVVDLHCSVGSSSTAASGFAVGGQTAGERMRACVEGLGRDAGAYVKARAGL